MTRRNLDGDDVQFRESTVGGFLSLHGWYLERTILRDERKHKTGERWYATRREHHRISVGQAWVVTMQELGMSADSASHTYEPEERELSETELEQRQLFERDLMNR